MSLDLSVNPQISPIENISNWLKQVTDAKITTNPNAACLSTLDQEGFPDGRIILIKDITTDSLVFFTNTSSIKGHQLEAHPKAGLTIHWDSIGRQIRAKGQISHVTEDASDRYFASRPRGSQIGAWASLQSHPLDSRDTLTKRVEEYTQKFDGQDVPRPPHWKGYALTPHSVEFWIDQPFRLHDRHVYTLENGQWAVERRYP